MATLSKLSVLVAAAGLAIVPVAAQAGTRAEASPVVVDVQRGSAGATDVNQIFGIDDALFAFLLILISGATATALDGRSNA